MWVSEWRQKTKRIAALLTALSCGFLMGVAIANPVLQNIPAGNVTVQQTSNTTTINQSSKKGIINWNSFNIGKQESTRFIQPTGGVTLNRINPTQGASQIYGILSATGRIILINSAGIYFGPGSYVNVGGLIATTAQISDRDFLHDNYQFSNVPGSSGSIINQGTIIAANHGLVALVGNSVENDGTIRANLGHIVLASGSAFTMSFAGDDLINFTINAPTTQAGVDQNGKPLKNGVSNSGRLIANGGQILVTASAAQGVLDHVINMYGVAEAKSIVQQNGEIIISGNPNSGEVYVNAKLDASGKNAGQTGGNVEITGNNILLDSNTNIDVSGAAGGGNIFVGGNAHGAGPLPNANATVMAPGAFLNASAITNGNGGNVVLWSENTTKVYGTILAEGGAQGGNGGFVETSSHNNLVTNALVNTSAPNGLIGTWLLDPANVTISTSSDTNYTNVSNIFEPNSGVATATVNNTTLANNLANNSITITTTNNGTSGGSAGTITVNAPITWSSSNTLTLNAASTITINNPITATAGKLSLISGVTSGNAIAINAGISIGTLSLQAGALAATITTNSAGTISASNFNLQKGTWNQVMSTLPGFSVSNNFQINAGTMPNIVAAFIRASSGNGTSGSPYVIRDIYGFQGIGSTTTTLANNWKLGGNISASGTSTWNSGAGFVPIGSSTTFFTGIFDGAGFTIDGVTINAPSKTTQGIFGEITGTVKNLGVTNVNIILNNGGALVGNNNVGSVLNSYSTGTVSATAANAQGIGGLIGTNTGTVTGDYSSAAVNVTTAAAKQIGGLIGISQGTNHITNSYSNGSVTVANNAINIGGLIGQLTGSSTLTNAYSTASVTTGSNSSNVGALIGKSSTNVSFAYSSGLVTAGAGSSNVHGFIGSNVSGVDRDDFFDNQTTGQVSDLRATGESTATLMTLSTFTQAGWNITATPSTSSTPPSSVWFIFPGETRPLLLTEWSNTITNAHQLQLMGAALGANYTLANNIKLSSSLSNKSEIWGGSSIGTFFVPIGSSTTPYTGTFNGQNFTLSGLSITQVAGTDIGLFANSSGTLENLQLSGVNITGKNTVGALAGLASGGTISAINVTGAVAATQTGASMLGGLVGSNSASISNATSVATVSSGVSASDVGGLVGTNASGGFISLSQATGSVTTGNNTGINVGGLVGLNQGSVSGSSASGTANGNVATGGLIGNNQGSVSDSYASGTVNGSGSSTGGLIGLNQGSVSDSYASGTTNGNVTTGGLIGYNAGNVADAYAIGSVFGISLTGGLIGWNDAGGTVTNAYSSGSVTSTGTSQGGLIGIITGGSVSNSFWDTQTSGQATSAGGTGKTTAQLLNLSTYSNAGWNIGTDPTTNTWLIFNGQTRPLLAMEYSTTIANAHQLQLIGLNTTTLNASYTLANNIDLAVTSHPADIWAGNGFSPVGNVTTPFTGVLNGQDHLVTETINQPSQNDVGLFGVTSSNANLSNIALAGLVVGNNNVGMLVGLNAGSIRNVYSEGSVTGSSIVGGLIGLNSGSIQNAYSISSVTASSNNAGGLVGSNSNTGTINDTYSTGLVSGPQSGGLAGSNQGVITNSFWDTQTSGQATSAGGTGKTTAQLLNLSTYSNAGWNIGTDPTTNTWLIFNGQTRPLLAMEYSTTITNAHQLQLIGLNTTTLNASYTLANNIDLSVTSNSADIWAGTFAPISNVTTPFSGSFNGQNNVINHLSLTPSTQIANVGLFGVLTGTIQNVGLINDNVNDTFSSDNVGSLVGFNKGNITGSYASGTVTGNGSTGGLIGLNQGSISDSYASGAINGNGSATGGLVGSNQGSGNISTSHASGTVNGNASSTGGLIGINSANVTNSYANNTVNGSASTGGLVGVNNGNVTGSYASSTVIGQGGLNGGLIGDNQGSVSDTFASGAVTGGGSTGGLIGLNQGSISDSYASGTINGSGSATGGLVGSNQGSGDISTSYASGTVNGNASNTGGLIGVNGADVTNSYASNTVTGSGFTGGLIGLNQSNVTDSYANGTVTGSGSMGGLIGDNQGSVIDSYASDTVTGSGSSTGGLIALNQGSVTGSYASGTVTGSDATGGLIGLNQSSGTISTSYASNTVTGSGSGTGGLIGFNQGSVTNSYANGTTNGNLATGGLIGNNQGSIIDSYASSTVNGSGSNTGGLVGLNQGNVSASYASGITNGNLTTGGLVGYNTGSVADTYAMGAVHSSGSTIGGLIGWNDTGGTVSHSYSTGLVTGTGGLQGGLIGKITGGSVSNSFWDTETSGQATSAAGTGLTTAQSLNLSTYSNAGWNIGTDPTTNTWLIFNGQTRPLLAMEYSTTITNAHQLQLIGINTTTLNASYTLANNLDLSVTSHPADIWAGNGFLPIANVTTPFSGTFDGQNNVISHLSFSSAQTAPIGLFGASSGTIENVGLINESINIHLDNNGDAVGGLVGENNGTISNVFSSNLVMQTTGGSNNWVGGLVGANVLGTISNASITGSMNINNASSSMIVGGLVGMNLATIDSTNSAVAVNSSGADDVGGLIGKNGNGGGVRNSYSTGSVTATGNSIGGLIGYNQGSVSGSYASGIVNGNGSGTGGLVGSNQSSGNISTSYASGTVTSSGSNTGGLVGINGATITSSYANNVVTGSGSTGGLVGFNQNNVSDSHADGTVNGSDSTGGLIGDNQGSVINSYANATVNGSGSGTGGLIGLNQSSVTASYASGIVNGSSDGTGGLVGINSGNVTGSYANGIINGSSTSTGGLVGINQVSGNISTSYASATVTGSGAGTGGLIGLNQGSVSNSYASSTVIGEDSLNGGLIGDNQGNVSDTFASGTVSGSNATGGLIGYNQNSVTDSYASGTVNSSGSRAGGLIGNNAGSVSDSYATGTVNSIGSSTGGLIGYNTGSVADTYAIGAVHSSGSATGGLIGWNDAGGTVSNSYSTGLVIGTGGLPGGLIGKITGGSISNSFWDMQTSGQAMSAAGTGLTTAQSLNLSTYSNAGWNIGTDPTTNTWLIFNGQTRPLLAMEYSTTITNAHQLELIGLNTTTLNASYTLANNLDLSVTSHSADIWAGNGFLPIANVTTPFSGSFDGQNNVINHLSLTPSAQVANVGLFGVLTGTIQNVGLINANVNDTFSSDNVGSLVGLNQGNITGSYASGTVTGSGVTGGLVGSNQGSGTISTSYASGAVNGSGSSAGGLVGVNSANVTNSYANNTVTGSGATGGLVGNNQGNVIDSYTSGVVNGSGSTGTGGLIGFNQSSVTGSYASGIVNGSGSGTGGLVGINSGDVTASYASNTINGSTSTGGLVGVNQGSGTISASYASSIINGSGSGTGGLVGNNQGSVTDSYAVGTVNSSGSATGGLVGNNNGSVADSYASSTVNSSGSSTGGLIGYNTGSVAETYAIGAVHSGGSGTGGLIGWNDTGGTVSDSYSSGLVMSTGGLQGGLIGKITGGSVSNSFWDTETSGQATSAAGTGITTAQSLDLSTYSNAGWNIGTDPTSNTWLIFDGLTRPLLAMEYSTTITNAHQLELIGINPDTLLNNYTLANNIDLSATSNPADIWAGTGNGFIPIGNYNTESLFGGDFNGQGHVISNLSITTSAQNDVVGLFGASAGTIENVGLVNEHMNISLGSNGYDVGGLVGDNYGAISNVFSSNLVLQTVGSGPAWVGGLVGANIFGIISNASITGSMNITNASSSVIVGGLVGANFFAAIANANSAVTVNSSGAYDVGGLLGKNGEEGSVSTSYSTGNVTGLGNSIGGLIGYNQGSVNDSYAIGTVNSGGSGAGGLIGWNDTGGTVTNAYSTGIVTGAGTSQGGLIGIVTGGSVSNSFWDTETSGQTTSAAGTGLTTAQSLNLSTYSNAGWNIGTDPTTNTWLIFNGQTRPLLAMEYSTTITNAHQLELIGINTATLNASYTLANNIDLSVTANPTDIWGGSNNGFLPIANAATPFSGSFNGQNNVLSNLSITSSTQAGDVGLFGVSTGTIENVGLINENVNDTVSSNNVGGLVGLNKGNVTGSFASGTVNNNGSYNGGLIGYNQGNVSHSYASATINSNGSYNGGLIGYNQGNVSDSYASGTINSSGAYSGGLIGYNQDNVTDSYATGTVFGASFTGGLIGFNFGTVTNSYSTGNVTGLSSSGYPTGGLIGYNSGIVADTYAIGTVTSSGPLIGGLIGWNVGGTVTDSYSAGLVMGTGGPQGGLIGNMTGGSVSNSFWDKTTSGQKTSAAGTGLTTTQLLNLSTYSNAGWNIGTDPRTNTWLIFNGQTRPLLAMEYSTTITNAHQLELIGINTTTLNANYTLANNLNLSATANPADVWGGTSNGFLPIANATTPFTGVLNGQGHLITETINRPSQDDVGLFGVTSGNANLSNVAITGTVVGNNNVGMLVGLNAGTITDVYSTGSVSGHSFVGDLVGTNTGTVRDAYSEGSVTGSSIVGGLIGLNSGSIQNAYSISSVTASSNNAGGLVGSNTGTINDTYSSGVVSGPQSGGLAGSNQGVITNSFWDTQTSGQATSAGGTGKTTAQLLNLSTYSNAGWNIGTDPTTNTWLIFNGQTRPLLAMEYSTTITNAHQLQLIGLNTTTLNASYTLANNIDLSVTSHPADIWGGTGNGFLPIGNVNTPFTGSLNGEGYQITHLVAPTNNFIPATSFSASLTNLKISGTVTVDQTEFDFTNNNYLGGTLIKQFILSLVPANLSICASCSDNVILSGNQYGNSTQLTFPVQDLIDLMKLGNVFIQASGTKTDNLGDILINTPIQLNSAFNLELSAYRNINANDSLLNTGGGSIALSADNTGTGIGTVGFVPGTNVRLSGGSGTVSIFYNPHVFGAQDVIYSGGTVPIQYMLINSLGNANSTTGASLATLSNTPAFWNENFALSTDIDASATASWNGGAGFNPIGSYVPGTFSPSVFFTGQFNGQGHIISNLTISPLGAEQNSIGLFGVVGTGGVISNIGLNNTHVNVTLGGVSGTGGYATGTLVGSNFGTVSNVFSSNGIIQANGQGFDNNIGGLIGYNNGSVSNAYSMGSIHYTGTNGTSGVAIGGLIGQNDASGTVSDTYSTTAASFSGNGVSVGGLAGSNLGSVQNSFWDTDTSNLAHAFGTNSGQANNVLGGCFSGSCANGGTVNLSASLTFTRAGWDFTNTWGIIPGQSYPYLLTFYPTTPEVISGQVEQFSSYYANPAWAAMPQQEMNPLWSSLTPLALAGQTVNLITNGALLDSTTTEANGFYYFLERNGTIPVGAPLLTDLSNSSNHANAITTMPTGGAGISKLILALNTVSVEGNGSPNYIYTPPGGSPGIFSSLDLTMAVTPYTLITNNNLVSVIGHLASNDLLYGVSGNQINVSNGYNFATSPDTLFGLTSNLNTSNGSITFNGPTQINPSSNSVTIQTNFGGNIETGNVISATGNAYTLNLISANNIYLNGLLLLRDSDHTGTTITNGSLNVSAAYTNQSISVNTANDSNAGYVVENFNLLQGKWFQVGGNANALANFQINSGVMPSSVAEYLQVLSGTGQTTNPYVINSIESLQGIGSDSYTLGLSYQYIASSFVNGDLSYLWNSNAGFVPIGTLSTPFTGQFSTKTSVLNGVVNLNLNGIADVYINRPNMDNVGIFGVTGSTAVLSNVFFTSDAVTGHNNVGVLVGLNQGSIENSLGEENFVVGNNNVGLLAGANSGSISNSIGIDSRVLGQIAGGLVGNNSGSINQSLAAVYVGGLGSSPSIGGLVGKNTGIIQNSFWDKNVTGQTLAAGGNSGTISNSYAGCYGNSCAVNLTNPATYLTTADGGLGLVSSSWDFTHIWNIQPGISYPYINKIFASQGTTARITSGQLSPASPNELLVQVWGVPFDDPTVQSLVTNTGYLITGANGSFYVIQPNNAFNSTFSMLISALGGNITGSVLFNLVQASAGNPTASQVNIPLLTSPHANSQASNAMALSNVQIDNLALGFPLNSVHGDSAFYLQQESNIVYNNGNGGNEIIIPLATPGIFDLAFEFALANAIAFGNFFNPSTYLYFYQQDLYSNTRSYFSTQSVGENIDEIAKNIQAEDNALLKHYEVEPIKPSWCAK